MALSDIIEVSGSPPLEGKEGFYGSYLQWLQNVIVANLKEDSLENNKIVVINLIEIGIAMIPDPENQRGKYGISRQDIYKKVDDYYNREYDEICKERNVKHLSTEEDRDLLYRAYVREGIGSMSTWYDNFVGVVTKNIVSRTGPGRK